MAQSPPDSEPNTQRPSSEQNIHQSVGSNQGSIQAVNAGHDANVIQVNLLLKDAQEFNLLLGQVASEANLPLLREISNYALEKTSYFINRFNLLKQAEKWLESEDLRRNLALNIANTTLKEKSLEEYLSVEAEENSKVDFVCGLYDCITWLYKACETGIAKDLKSGFKGKLSKHDKLYISAIVALKRRTKKKLKDKKDVANIIEEYADMLIEKILSTEC